MTGQAPTTERRAGPERIRWLLAMAVIAIAGCVLRLLYLHGLSSLPLLDHPVGDSAAYLARARDIASGDLLPTRPFFYGSIFYPYLLALAVPLGGAYQALPLQILAGTALIVVLADLARRLYGTRAGVAAGVLAALYAPFAFLEVDFLGVAFGLLALALGALACVAWLDGERRGVGRRLLLLAAGVAFGLAATERPNLVILIPLVALWCAWSSAARWRAALPVLGGAVLPLGLVLALNVGGTGEWVPLTTSAGINLSIGYHAGAPGTYEEPWERSDPHFAAAHADLEEASGTMASIQTGRRLTPNEASGHWMRAAGAFVRDHPGDAAGMTLRKLALLLNHVEIPNHLDFAFMRREVPALRLMPVTFALVLPLSVLGLGGAMLRRTRPAETALLAVLAVGALASVVPFFVADRYRAPMVPPLIVAAGAGVALLLDLLRAPALRRDRRMLVVLGGAVLAVAVSLLPVVRPLIGRDYWMLAQAYESRDEPEKALAAYESAVRDGEPDAALLNNMASLYRRLGRRDLAIATLKLAIAVDPSLAYPHKNLGMALVSVGRLNQALPAFRRAAGLAPDDAQVRGMIAAIHAERGDVEVAAREFSEALALAPSDSALVRLVAHYPGVARRLR